MFGTNLPFSASPPYIMCMKKKNDEDIKQRQKVKDWLVPPFLKWLF
jgi:hypothetical protein